MKYIKTSIVAIGVVLVAGDDLHPAHAQGCVAVRGGSCPFHPHDAEATGGEAGDWQVSVGYRWLHSGRHFVGDREQPQRQELGTEVINDSHFMDLSVQYQLTPRYSLQVVLPFVYSDRSSLYEHDRQNRYHTQAAGFGDFRLGTFAWLWSPEKAKRGNLLLGVGAKFPTGDEDATDLFYPTNGPVRRPVDQSIQPGDGGFGFTLEAYGYLQLFHRTAAYLQGFYLFNPENVNGVSTETGTRRANPYEQVMSIPDQYLGRVGLSYLLWPAWGLGLELGGRIEGVPVHDAIGSEDGFRRPGFAISIEPALTLIKGKYSASLSAPVALYRNRERSVADERWSEDTGTYRHGDAAFADYVITFSVARRF
jgi:hypothetical protein